MSNELEAMRAERNAAFENLDIEFARKVLPQASSDEVLLIAMHKARYETTDIEDSLRHESAAYLKANGYGRMYGVPFPEDGSLPR